MNPIKINISPEVQAFNAEVEDCDRMTDYKFDQESEDALLQVLRYSYPYHAKSLAKAMINLDPYAKPEPVQSFKAIVKLLDGSQPKDIPGALMVAQSAIKRDEQFGKQIAIMDQIIKDNGLKR